MNKRRACLTILSAVLSSFVAIVYLGCSSVSAAVTLVPAYEQKRNKDDPFDMAITDTVTGADGDTGEVILDKTKVNFYQACANISKTVNWADGNNYIMFSGNTVGKFVCKGRKYNADNTTWLLHKGKSEKGNNYVLAIDMGNSLEAPSKNFTGANDSIKIISKGAARDIKEDKTYDILFTITNIRIRTGWCHKGKKSTGTNKVKTKTWTGILWGMGTVDPKAVNDTSVPPEGTSMFTGKSFYGYRRCYSGAMYDVSIKLLERSTDATKPGKAVKKTMLWAFNDIDIMDRITDNKNATNLSNHIYYHPNYSKIYPLAEHIKFFDGILDGRNSKNISLVESKKGAPDSDPEIKVYNGNTIYHAHNAKSDNNYVTASDGGVADNSANALVRVQIDTGEEGHPTFKFEWGGSSCGTYIDDAPVDFFKGQTLINYVANDGVKTYSGNANITVHSEKSGEITFIHQLSRADKHDSGGGGNSETPPEEGDDGGDDGGDDDDGEDGEGGDEDSETTTGDDQIVSSPDETNYYVSYNHNGSSGELPEPPGSTGIVTGLTFEWKDAHKSELGKIKLDPGQSKAFTQNLHFRSSNVNESRENYKEVGPHTITVTRPQATFTGKVTPSVNGATVNNNGSVKISGDGSYTIGFANSIKRNNDGAGSTVGSNWTTSMRIGGVNGSIPSGYGEHTGTANRTQNQDYSTDGIRQYTYTGTLRYGEKITFCGLLEYDSIVNVNIKPYPKATASGCVTIYRDNGRCAFDDRFEFGLNYAVNTGRIGVQNKNLANSPTYTVPNDLTAVSIYARPTDNIRFFYDMCAGTMYPIKEKGLSATVTYKATGESTKSNGEGNGYLFRQDVSVVDGTFYNPRFWTNNNDGHTYNFLRQDIEARFSSPSNHVGTNYRCGGGTESGWYQVAGKEDCARNSTYDIGVIDAGSTITQRLEWNEQTYNNGSFGNSPRAASASVVVPYNYILRPYVTNKSGNTGKVAYLGETLTMTPGVVTVARTNVFPTGGSQNYATITKPTDINVKYYFKTSGGSVISESVVETSSRSQFRLNSDGLINGTVSADSQKSVDDGGTQLPQVTVQIPNSGVSVGDKVCVEVSVYPADSHDMKDASSVSGAGIGDIALSETSANSSNWVTSVSCSTIAKKPSMSVESSNAYSATRFKTANYTRTVGTKKFNFGSWSEYGVFGRVIVGSSTNNSLFASGAALGYSRDGYPATRTANAPRANDETSADNNKVSTASNSSKCTFMTQTFANANCNSSNTSLGGVMASQYEQRIKERYGSSSGSFITAGLPTVSYNGATYYDVSNYSGADVIVEPSGIIRFASKENLYINALPRITNDQYASKNIEKPNPTIVYSAPDKNIVIDGNLNEDNGGKNGLDGITQVIIIAKNVYFTSNPTYVNAIIIANEVNTCRFSGGNKVSVGGKGSASVIDSGTCSGSLRFDSPVIVKRLILNRTAGAGNGDDAIRRAEIFNLNMANYLWSFNQMSRLSQATTTYLRELPTRY